MVSKQGDRSSINARDLTDWLYREMKYSLQDSRLQFVKQANKVGSVSLALFSLGVCPLAIIGLEGGYGTGMHAFYELVKDHGPYDPKHRIKDRLGPAVTLCSSSGCQHNIESSVLGNIFFGFVAKEAGYLGSIIQAGAGIAQATDPSHDPVKAQERGVTYLGPYDPSGKFQMFALSTEGIDVNLGDDPGDNRAIAFGIRLHQKYGRSLTLAFLKQELVKVFPNLDRLDPNSNPVQRNIAAKWPYAVGYFDPTKP